MRRVLLIAFHYPPAVGSSGIQRTLSFSRYLRENAWEPLVLTANSRAYPRQSADQVREVPGDIEVVRAFALDASRHLAIGGRYFRSLAYPDRWVTWALGGIASGLRCVRRNPPDLIWSTFPIATAHLIGYALHRMTSIPWVADFRDSMTEDEYPSDGRTRQIYRWIERKTMLNAAFSVFTAPRAVDMYASRYPEVDSSRLKCIPNGYDERAFANCDVSMREAATASSKTVLLHSGVIYPSERDPTALFSAVQQLMGEAYSGIQNLEIRLRASGFEEELQSRVESAGIGHIVKLAPAIGYADALTEMMNADGLLILQASNCNHQIPAKIYEYLRTRRPVLALTDPAGDTAALLRENGISTIAPLDSRESIVTALKDFLQLIATNSAPVAPDEKIESYSRRRQTKELAELFNSAVK